MEKKNLTENFDFLEIPDLGKTGKIELVKWYMQKDQTFQSGEEMCDLVTDKAVFSVEAPYDGKLLEVLIPEKNIVHPGEKAAKVKAFLG